jgi:hypothetical protein
MICKKMTRHQAVSLTLSIGVVLQARLPSRHVLLLPLQHDRRPYQGRGILDGHGRTSVLVDFYVNVNRAPKHTQPSLTALAGCILILVTYVGSVNESIVWMWCTRWSSVSSKRPRQRIRNVSNYPQMSGGKLALGLSVDRLGRRENQSFLRGASRIKLEAQGLFLGLRSSVMARMRREREESEA